MATGNAYAYDVTKTFYSVLAYEARHDADAPPRSGRNIESEHQYSLANPTALKLRNQQEHSFPFPEAAMAWGDRGRLGGAAV
jgi:hypothetical protein